MKSTLIDQYCDSPQMSSFPAGNDLGEEGLYYFNARWYDPTLGRFITEDPIKDGVNWFAYVANNPLRYTDPTGLKYNEEVGDGLFYDNESGEYSTRDGSDVKDNTYIKVERDVQEENFWDGQRTVMYKDTPIYSEESPSRTKPCMSQEYLDENYRGGSTVPYGESTGYLMDSSPSYDNPILVENIKAGIQQEDLVMQHPPTKTQKLLGDPDGTNDNREYGPYSNAYVSAACNVSQDTEAFTKFNNVLQDLGFEFKGKFEWVGSFDNGDPKHRVLSSSNPDTIRIETVPVNVPWLTR